MRTTLIIIAILVLACNSNPVQEPELNKTDSVSLPEKQKTALPQDSLLISERIDGPANMRDTVNGTLLFILNDNVPVTTTEAQNGWLQIGIFAELTSDQAERLVIKKGSKIYLGGNEVGYTVRDVKLGAVMHTRAGDVGELVGYSSIQNIKPYTIPEKSLDSILNDKSGQISRRDLQNFLTNFEFQSYGGLVPGTKGFEIDENWIDDPSPLLRLWLIFEDDSLAGIFHSRPLHLSNTKTVSVERGFFYTSYTYPSAQDSALIKDFNSYINQVD